LVLAGTGFRDRRKAPLGPYPPKGEAMLGTGPPKGEAMLGTGPFGGSGGKLFKSSLFAPGTGRVVAGGGGGRGGREGKAQTTVLY